MVDKRYVSIKTRTTRSVSKGNSEDGLRILGNFEEGGKGRGYHSVLVRPRLF